MSIPRWTPSQTVSAKETKLLARHKRLRKLFVFLRLYRHELFDDAFQTELESIYRSTGAGKLPCPPALRKASPPSGGMADSRAGDRRRPACFYHGSMVGRGLR